MVAWRRLLTQRTPAQQDACARFVREVDGRRYSYDPIKILFSVRRADEQQAERVDAAYYCSELVCALYQKCGLMRKACRAASFWPGDLAAGGVCERWLCDGVSLAPEVVCDTSPAVAATPPRRDAAPSPAMPTTSASGELQRITSTLWNALPSLTPNDPSARGTVPSSGAGGTSSLSALGSEAYRTVEM